MAKKKSTAENSSVEFAFFNILWQFYFAKKRAIRKHYKEFTKRFIDYNDPDNNVNSFLRRPQFEALEIYIFLKEFCNNKPIQNIFENMYKKENEFSSVSSGIAFGGEELRLFEHVPEKEYSKIFDMMKNNSEAYSNYIFALAMGTGKTIFMATCIFYEFLLANKFPKDKKYCHNALVFAPDKTVLQSLKEIETFDKSKVIPPDYMDFINSNIKIHFLDGDGTLNTIDKSDYNIIISNTHKIILMKKHKDQSPSDKLYKPLKVDTPSRIRNIFNEIRDSEDIKDIFDEEDVKINQRFEKLLRLNQLGVYVDEAHHLFGKSLEDDLLKSDKKTSLRYTIDELAKNLEKVGTHVVACYNFTGTPYVKKQILPEVVYSYGLKKAIDNKYLKTVSIKGYSNIKSKEFIREAIKNFWETYSGKTYEGLNPKLAFFSPNVEDLTDNLKPMFEEVLQELEISTDKILVNVGDSKETTNDDIRNFNNLDKVGSLGNEKQFILLVNKGREGWNCRSLFGVALFRAPKSKIFVLQATMRCLRQIGEFQEEAKIFLSEENYQILSDELDSNYNLSIKDIEKNLDEKKIYDIKIIQPVKKIKLKRIRHKYEIKEINTEESIDFELGKISLEKYQTFMTERKNFVTEKNIDVTERSDIKEQRFFSNLSLVAEISRYLNCSCIKIENILHSSKEGISEIVSFVNRFNDILYDEIIPKIFNSLYKIEESIEHIEDEIELIRYPKGKDYFTFRTEEKNVVKITDIKEENLRKKSFHVDTYCFDSMPEKELFWILLRDKRIKEIFFTGMFTHGQSDFYVQYINPDSQSVRSYYPDFLVQREDGVIEILEVKADISVDDIVVQAKKKYAEEMARENNMVYEMIKSSDIMNGDYKKNQQKFY